MVKHFHLVFFDVKTLLLKTVLIIWALDLFTKIFLLLPHNICTTEQVQKTHFV